jgi:hypothetical protein
VRAADGLAKLVVPSVEPGACQFRVGLVVLGRIGNGNDLIFE